MEVYPMKEETKKVWERYCAQAAVEQDPDKLLELVKEINRMLEEKEDRLLRAREQSPDQQFRRP
jgi:malate synthase